MSGDYLAHGATLTLVWFVATNVLMCAAIAIAYRVISRWPAVALSTRAWLMIRLAPAVAGGAFALLLFVPSYLKFEPRDGVEGFDVSLTLAAAVGAALVTAAAGRGIIAWLAARRRVRAWMRHARPVSFADGTLPAYLVDADQPMIALVGVVRPRLLLTRGLIETLTEPELRAAIAHEVGHQRSFDNLKRLVMRATPDLLPCFGVARTIERRWAAAAEHAADRIAGPDAVDARCALASALVKVARLMPAVVPAAEPISTLISGGDIAARVQRLLSDDTEITATAARRSWWAAVIVSAVAVAAAYGPLLRSVHELTEVLVHTLP